MKTVHRRLPSRRWLLAGVVVGATGLAASGQPTATATAVAASPAPVIDTGYLYGQLYDMATSDVYRISGADGPPQDPSSPFNLPSTINGWQELVAHWKGELTSPAAMGDMARFATASDHYFRRPGGYRFDSNDAEVTIPGAACPGQRVLLAAHPDNVPVPSSVASDIATGSVHGNPSFESARRKFTLSNLGNGGAYDDTSGVAMTMAEYQALLRWYAANGTWPSRTLKVALLDAHQDRPQSPSDAGAEYYVGHLIPRGPQGQYSLFANMDMNGLEYPAYHWGTEFYLNDLQNGGVGPWFTNIAATPLAPNAVYPDRGPGSPWANIAANLPAVRAFRGALESAVTSAFQTLGQKYDFSVPLENPLRYDQPGQVPLSPPTPVVKPAYTPSDQARYSPVRDDAIGRFDQVAFLSRGIPGYDVLGAFDSNGDENPYPASVASKPPILQYTGYDTTFQIGDFTPNAQAFGLANGFTGDTLDHLNYWASGNVHGLGGIDTPSEELMRALELPSTWTADLLAADAGAGATARPSGPIAYFETTTAHPARTLTVDFDASFSRSSSGDTNGLQYVWDFGDGTTATGGPTISHTYARGMFADVKLLVRQGSQTAAYRQAVDVKASNATPPATDPCGTVGATERAKLLAVARAAGDASVQGDRQPAGRSER
jgi:hypothetical protein